MQVQAHSQGLSSYLPRKEESLRERGRCTSGLRGSLTAI